MATGDRVTGVGEDGIIDEKTITLEELSRRLKEAAASPYTKKANRLLFLNVEAALRALGLRLEAADAELSELKNKPLIVGPGGSRVN